MSTPSGEDGIFVNLYVAGTAKIALGDNTVPLTQETDTRGTAT